jgi:predicted phosphodiesterase
VGTRSAQLAQQATQPEIPWNDIEQELASYDFQRTQPVDRGLSNAGYIVGVADGQLGKVDGDGVKGALQRSVEYLDEAREDLDFWRQRYDIAHVEIPFLGDMLEGFVSQGGANAWRTALTPGEQYRLVRRIMLHALKLFAGSAPQVSMVAIPGNHDQTIRFQGKGTTKYDDSWDVEALIAIADHAKDIEVAKDVKFYVPRTDEMTVVTKVAGTTMAYAHGHQFKPGKHFDWWKGQGFGGSPLADADVLMVGHLHHELMEADGRRTFLQAPSLESESTWFRHNTGATGNPGLMTAIVADGEVKQVRVIR